MNLNTISHPALAIPASPLSHAVPHAPRGTPAGPSFSSLLQQADQAPRTVASHLSAAARSFSAQAAMNHAQ